MTYGELIGGKTFSLKLDHAKPAKAKDPKDYKIVGKSVPRVDIPDKVTGTFTYMQDFRVPGMLHGRVVRPPAIGAKLESVDEGSIKDIPGIVKVVREGNFLGVVAQSEWAAIKARATLKATWSKSETLPEQAKLWEHVRATKVVKDEVTSNVGNAAEAMAKDGVEELPGDLRFRHPHPRLDRAVLRGGRIQGRQADLVVGLAGDPRSAQAARARCSACRSRTCAASISKAPAATAATATRTPPPTPRCSPRRSASRCACNGRAPTSTAGTRRARRR